MRPEPLSDYGFCQDAVRSSLETPAGGGEVRPAFPLKSQSAAVNVGLLENQGGADHGAPAQRPPASPDNHEFESDLGGADDDKFLETDASMQRKQGDADGGAPAQELPDSLDDYGSESDLGGDDEDQFIESDCAVLGQQANADGGAPAQEETASRADLGGADEDKMIEVDWQQIHSNDAGADVHGSPTTQIPNEAIAPVETTWASSLAHSSHCAAHSTLCVFWHVLF